MIFQLAAATALAAGFAALPAPAAAQAGERISEIIVYGNDPCPRSTDDEVVICVRRPETERYRISEAFRTSGDRQERTSWANKSRSLMGAGNTGINSCSAVGPAAHTGCLLKEIQENEEANREANEAATAPDL